MKIVDHMAFGRVIRIDAGETGFDWGEISRLGSLERLVGPREGKIELGVFVKEERPEFTESLRDMIKRAGGA